MSSDSSSNSDSSIIDDSDKDPSVKYYISVDPREPRTRRNIVDSSNINNPGATAVEPIIASKTTSTTAVVKSKNNKVVSKIISDSTASCVVKEETPDQTVSSTAKQTIHKGAMDEDTKAVFKNLGTSLQAIVNATKQNRNEFIQELPYFGIPKDACQWVWNAMAGSL